MALVVRSVEDLFRSYKEWVCANPQLTSEIESSVKWLSYFVAGKISDSAILSEMVYCMSNLWVLFNDKIIMNANEMRSAGTQESVKTWLTVVEYSEVFIEISARQVWGDKGRWILIAVIQVYKCILRLLLVLQYRENILPSPPVAPLKRKELQEKRDSAIPEPGSSSAGSGSVFTLRSGRTIRSVNGAPDIHMRSWKPPQGAGGLANDKNSEKNEKPLSETQRLGEALYIMKPLVHLGSMYCFGETAWKPWMFSLATDLASMVFLTSSKDGAAIELTNRQKVELFHRKLALILYLMRSPFYDRYTRHRLHRILIAFSESVPLVGIILKPLAEYIPQWQNTYLYMWSS